VAYTIRKRDAKTNSRAKSLRQGDNMAEAVMWNELKARRLGGYKFVRQMPIGPFFADFVCRDGRLVIEIDGSQHADSEHDARRDEFMRRQGYSILRFWNTDVLKRRNAVCETILSVLDGKLSASVHADGFRYMTASDD
jgi:very-short-patch-repair endonuclease